ncbi:hypothetical protein H262_11559 [Citrobacter freundii GTC 09479]|nr:hypothetical protein H262_11559 [Citrobacter freundii GTC 09479]
MAKETRSIGVRITPLQEEYLQKLVDKGKVKNMNQAIQYMLNSYIALSSK